LIVEISDRGLAAMRQQVQGGNPVTREGERASDAIIEVPANTQSRNRTMA